MVGKIIAVILAFSILAFSIGLLYQNLPGETQFFSIQEEHEQEIIPISYGPTPVFSEKLRFNHNRISFYINPSCSQERKNSMLEAFSIFQNKMGIINFYELESPNADIIVECPDKIIEVREGYMAAGEGGPSEIIETDLFNVINKGKIFIYDDSRCDYPIVEMHELLHVFGFNHTDNPKSAMYPISDCEQRITSDMVETIQSLYTVVPLTDIYIQNLSATKSGRYLDFNITIKNEGLLDAPPTKLTIFSKGKLIDEIEIEGIKIGAGRTIQIRNMKMFSRNIEEVEFAIDIDNLIRELDRENNYKIMILSQ